MQYLIEHPAIIERTRPDEDGRRYALVRAKSYFDIEELSGDQAPVACEIEIKHRGGGRTIRSVGGHFYADKDIYPARAIGQPDGLAELLLKSGATSFPSFLQIMETMVNEETSDLPGSEDITGWNRPLPARPRRRITDRLVHAYEKSPELKAQSWASSNALDQVSYWADLVQRYLQNIRIVDGQVYVRCSEPTLTLSLDSRPTLSYSHTARIPSFTEYLPDDDIIEPAIRSGSGRLAMHFSPNDLVSIEELSEVLGNIYAADADKVIPGDFDGFRDHLSDDAEYLLRGTYELYETAFSSNQELSHRLRHHINKIDDPESFNTPDVVASCQEALDRLYRSVVSLGDDEFRPKVRSLRDYASLMEKRIDMMPMRLSAAQPSKNACSF